jgi:hypothetical protein
METEFRVGDIVDWLGIRGVVTYISKDGNDLDEYMYVKLEGDTMDDYDLGTEFFPDGRYMKAHKEPSLKLIERPKRKVKKRFYMMAYKCEGCWHQASVLVDESFKDCMGIEHLTRFQRKILENSPYIEVEVDA